jgi:hypothetical protein
VVSQRQQDRRDRRAQGPTLPSHVARWICEHHIRTLNVAGNRASKASEDFGEPGRSGRVQFESRSAGWRYRGTGFGEDDRVMLARYDFTLDGKPAATYHYLADLETGAVTHR